MHLVLPKVLDRPRAGGCTLGCMGGFSGCFSAGPYTLQCALLVLPCVAHSTRNIPVLLLRPGLLFDSP